jgi:molybdate transport system substrate-binding protein
LPKLQAAAAFSRLSQPRRLRPAKRFALLTAILCAQWLACSPRKPPSKPTPAKPEIVVAAAISLREAFLEMGQTFQKQTGTTVHFSFGASGELEKQIEAGAPIDIFASAGEREMAELQAKGLIQVSSRADLARNSLVLVVPADSKLRLSSFPALAGKAVKRVAIGNPRTVPAGYYAQQLLRNLHLWDPLEPRLIPAENVRQVLDYVMREEVDAGIVYATDVAIAHGKVKVRAVAPEGKYGPILYPIAILQQASNHRAAQRFESLVLGSEGQRILAQYGFRNTR